MMVNLANHWVDRHPSIEFLVASEQGPFRELLDPRVQLRVLGARSVFLAIPALAMYLRRAHPAVVLTALTNVNIAILLARILARQDTRIVISERNNFSSVARYSHSWRNRWLLPWLARLTYPMAEEIVGISRGTVDDLASSIGLPVDRMTTIYNPVVVPGMGSTDCTTAAAVHPWVKQRMDVPLIIASGRLEPQKDYPTLLRAIRRVCVRRPVHLLVLGEGAERRNLEALASKLGIANNVCFMGFVDQPLAFMRQADLFVMSSAWEGFGNVLVEALYCGLPVVSTDCPSGPSEILENGRYGTLVPVGHDRLFADAIIASLDAPGSADERHRRAQAFSVSVIADQYMARMTVPG